MILVLQNLLAALFLDLLWSCQLLENVVALLLEPIFQSPSHHPTKDLC